MKDYNITLRQRKHFQTKIAILKAILAKLKKNNLEDISVKELCKEAQISEGTFFNYFPKKTDVLKFYVQLWSIEVSMHAKKIQKEKGSLAAINGIFYYSFDEKINDAPILFEIIRYTIQLRKKIPIKDLSTSEKSIAFPSIEDIEQYKSNDLDATVVPFLQQALKDGELPKDIDLNTLGLSIRSIFFGVPLALGLENVEMTKAIYQKNLESLWHTLNC
ncbi:TetR/AcrR family transcriptional regulator [Patescibacteria group bacterium]|nr:TetR/AcrR family transcriptional regulator [Patescibacteria group bacterium]